MTRESLVIAICALLLGVASPPAEASIIQSFVSCGVKGQDALAAGAKLAG